jgi:hypothetical protein
MRFIIYFVNLTFNLVNDFAVKIFIILTKFRQVSIIQGLYLKLCSI